MRLSFSADHAHIAIEAAEQSLSMGAHPLPVFAMVPVRYDQAIKMHTLVGDWIARERLRRNPRCPVTSHALECTCGGEGMTPDERAALRWIVEFVEATGLRDHDTKWNVGIATIRRMLERGAP